MCASRNTELPPRAGETKVRVYYTRRAGRASWREGEIRAEKLRAERMTLYAVRAEDGKIVRGREMCRARGFKF